MPRFEATRLIDVPADLAFQVAADVGNYDKFLPLLQRSTVRGARLKEGGVERFRAELVVAYASLGIREAFVSDVSADSVSRVVEAKSQDGPFKHVTTRWTVKEDGARSSVSVVIDYALRNPLVQMAVTGAMPSAIEKLMTAFEGRARSLSKVA
jgi:coenzyme Q-binding protein COQ10